MAIGSPGAVHGRGVRPSAGSGLSGRAGQREDRDHCHRPAAGMGQVCYNVAVSDGAIHADDHDLGHVLSNDSGVITERGPDTVRGADVCFYSYERVPKGPLPPGYLDVDARPGLRGPLPRGSLVRKVLG